MVRSWQDSYVVNRQLRHWSEITRTEYSGSARASMFLHDKTFFPSLRESVTRVPPPRSFLISLNASSGAARRGVRCLGFRTRELHSATFSASSDQILTKPLLFELTQPLPEQFPSARGRRGVFFSPHDPRLRIHISNNFKA